MITRTAVSLQRLFHTASLFRHGIFLGRTRPFLVRTMATRKTMSKSADQAPSLEKLRVAIFDCKYLKDQLNDIEKHKPRIHLTYYDCLLTQETAALAVDHDAVSLFVNGTVDITTVKILKNVGVGLIALRCAGFNHVDVAACRQMGVSVTSVPAYSPYAVAEFAVTLLLAINRKVILAYNRIRNGNFALQGLGGFDMHGKTVGVLGTGKIGLSFCSIMLGFGCKILAVDPYPNPALLDNPSVRYVTHDEMFKCSDVIALFAPATDENKHIINRYTIAHMKEGVIILNTARGSLIKTPDLVDAIIDKRVGGAGLDVLEEEGGLFYEDHSSGIVCNQYVSRLMTFPNVILTSHMSFLTTEALANIAETTMFNIGEYLEGKRNTQLTNSVLKE
eukprot:CFRG6165T1